MKVKILFWDTWTKIPKLEEVKNANELSDKKDC